MDVSLAAKVVRNYVPQVLFSILAIQVTGKYVLPVVTANMLDSFLSQTEEIRFLHHEIFHMMIHLKTKFHIMECIPRIEQNSKKIL
ncbi:hypothetical protein KL86DPRO_30122 [uncultured delta proteobacterium]|uniref:Uncharacterized protein n=1 Tax=uncultured delta proteobacterium TaxID=34034 RepID=A0A212K7X0_9DELT|nr:hypothetical protein KL86DPRO_30122 [uncultured delta proteobacterium]